MNVLIVGYGEIGHAIHDIVKEKYTTYILDPSKNMYVESDVKIDIIHICIPYSRFDTNFFVTISNLLQTYPKVQTVIINSTIDTECFKCCDLDFFQNVLFIHHPIRGTYPNIALDIKRFVNFIGLITPKTCEFATRMHEFCSVYYSNLGIQIEYFDSYHETVFAKLLNTSWYGMQIAFAIESLSICEHQSLNFDQVYTRMMETDEIGRKYSMQANGNIESKEKIPRPVMFPGEMGGHCILPNLELLKWYAQDMCCWIESTSRIMEQKKFIATVGYMGIPFQTHKFETLDKLKEFVNTLRPANKRPTYLLLSHCNIEFVLDIAENVLYASQVFQVVNNTLIGGTSYTRKYLAKHFNYKDGGDLK